MHKPKPRLSQHRRKRLALWAQLVLVWVAAALLGERIGARRMRRLGDISLDALARLVRDLILVRAGELASRRAPPRRNRPMNMAPGVRRARPNCLSRPAAGSRLRQALKHREPLQRIRLLLAALADIDSFARRYVVPRFTRMLTRLFALVVAAPAAQAVHSLATPCIQAADSS